MKIDCSILYPLVSSPWFYAFSLFFDFKRLGYLVCFIFLFILIPCEITLLFLNILYTLYSAWKISLIIIITIQRRFLPPRVQKEIVGGMHEGHVASPQGARASISTCLARSISKQWSPPTCDHLFDVTSRTFSNVPECRAEVGIVHDMESMWTIPITFWNDDKPFT